MFAIKGGVTKAQSPSKSILNHELKFNAYYKEEVGEYLLAHEGQDNTIQSHILGANTTRPSTDEGDYYSIRLSTE